MNGENNILFLPHTIPKGEINAVISSFLGMKMERTIEIYSLEMMELNLYE